VPNIRIGLGIAPSAVPAPRKEMKIERQQMNLLKPVMRSLLQKKTREKKPFRASGPWKIPTRP
jgi:hypothetical protein